MATRKNKAVWFPEYNRWQIKVQRNGVRKTFTSSIKGRAGQDECHKKADKWLESGSDLKITRVSDAYKEWIESLKKRTSYDHWHQYDFYGRSYILPIIGNKKVSQLDQQSLQRVIDSAFQRGLAKKTLQNIRGCLSSFMKYCRTKELTTLVPETLEISRNAAKGIRTILHPEHLRILFTSTETTMYNKVCDDHYIYAYRAQALSGLRPGELIGLKRSDDVGYALFIRGAINVHGENTTGKNENAVRSVPITAQLRQVLDAQYAMLREKKIKSEYIFCSPEGIPVIEKRYRLRLERYCEHNGLPKITPYELRHTFVSAAKTLPEGIIKSLVGHSESMDTFGVYSHALSEDTNTQTALLENIFGKILPK